MFARLEPESELHLIVETEGQEFLTACDEVAAELFDRVCDQEVETRSVCEECWAVYERTLLADHGVEDDDFIDEELETNE